MSAGQCVKEEDCSALVRSITFNEITEIVNNHLAKLLGQMIKNANCPKDFRPISCFNVVYKIISTMLAIRLKSVLKYLVNQSQSVFIEGRNIAYNISLVQELLGNYKRKHVSKRCMLKLDISKAHDSVEWDFLKQAMEIFGFHVRFIEWIMACVSSVKFSVLVNGGLEGYFGSSRAFPSSLLKIKEALITFKKWSGLIISEEKSAIYFGGCSESEENLLASIVCFQKGQLPFNYLDVLLHGKRLKGADFSLIIDKMMSKIKAWLSRFLSYADDFSYLQKLPLDRDCLREEEPSSVERGLQAETCWRAWDLEPEHFQQGVVVGAVLGCCSKEGFHVD
ncbi:hypothetical protein QQ045_023611 [Rhodiola kirilowii]